jgi:hypothetical protein
VGAGERHEGLDRMCRVADGPHDASVRVSP